MFFFKRSKKEKECVYKTKFDNFFSDDRFISTKDLNKFKEEINESSFLIDLYKNNTLKKHCKQNKLKYDSYLEYVNNYLNISKIKDEHNKNFIERKLLLEKDYLDNILNSCDPNIKLDNEQRKAILNDEDYTLIIAGAGAGKTTTVSAKVKYLVDKKNIKPEEILVISFTNKAVDELKERINKNLKIDCPVTTFHSTGNAIIRKNQTEKLNVATDGSLYYSINDYLQKYVLNNHEMLNKLVLFFSYYLDFGLELTSEDELKKELSSKDISTIKSELAYINESLIENKVKSKYTALNEKVRSLEEVRIANFLYMNSIDYEYEKPYQYYIVGAKKIYTPDFTISQNGKTIYLEHFGISESGNNTRFSIDELNRYKKQIEDKIKIHKDHGTKLIYTYSKYNDNKSYLDKLKELLIKEGFVLTKRSPEDVYAVLNKNKENRYFTKFIKLMLTFINLFKANGLSLEDFDSLKLNSTSERNRVFLDIAKSVYTYYQTTLQSKNSLDFQDMINQSTKILKEVKDMKTKLNFKYIFVDEYQDISMQRFNLTKALSEVTDAKIVAVGDDWQSIYAFSGAKLDLFTEFKDVLGYASILQITHTYRNSQELINIAGDFIQKNDKQIKKQLISPKRINNPVAIFTYSDVQNKNESKGLSGILEEKAKRIDYIIGVILKRQTKVNSSILLLGRYGFEAEKLGQSSYFTYDRGKIKSCNYPDVNLTFMTAHSSKGLGYDDVIIINGMDGLYGFPSQIKDDPVLNLVRSVDRSYEYAEERRLFYVALTRTKNRVYIVAPQTHPSRFVIELIEMKSKDIYLDNQEISMKKNDYITDYKKCPNCGFPLHKINNKYYGKKLWVCTNDPEVCDFQTNDLKGGKTRIRKCPKCTDGYLFINKQKEKDRYFLGCSNYNPSGKGCRYAENLDYDPLVGEM